MVSLLDIPILQPGDVDVAHTLFIQQFQMDTEHHNMWTPVVLNWFKHIILWFQSYGCTFGECPDANALCAETLCIIPKDFAKVWSMMSATQMYVCHTYQATTALLHHGAHQSDQTACWAPRLPVNEV